VLPLIDEYATISKQISEHKKQLERNKKLITNSMQSNALRELTVDDISLKLSSRKGMDFPDIPKLESHLHSQGLRDQASSVTRFKIASLISERVVSAEELGESVANTPFAVLYPAKI
jgi:hypothetical protein